MTSTPSVFRSGGRVAAVVWKPAVLTAYCTVVATVAYHHEPWFDEAQAWLLARDASLPDLCLRYLRYEGTPGLWHLLLMAPAKLGFPYRTMQLLAALSAAAGAALVLWLSPCPAAVRAAIPFTYFLLYQYAVVARSYVLVAPLLFAIAWLFPRARSKPWILIALLILLANVSLHGTLAAVGILLAYLIGIWTDPDPSKPGFSRQLLISCGVFLLALVVVTIEAWPVATDPFVHQITQVSHFSSYRERGVDQIAEAFSFRLSFTAVLLALSLFWMARNRTALYFVLPAGLVLGFSSLFYSSAWHAGILYVLWLFGMWIATNRNARTTPLYVWLAWVMVLGMHGYWAVRASLQDINAPYSGSKALAANIAPDVAAGKRIVGQGFMLTAVQPYFKKNIFVSDRDGTWPAFWFSRSPNYVYISRDSLATLHPDLIVASLWKMQPSEHDQLIRLLSDSGYTVIQEFPGEIVWKSGILISDSYLAARKTADP